ncbi:hypothetical protein BN130_2065 [Cronobacter malonaticus 507]|nr:hypothetical protein BN130_2065 [Cronobacter malonaticus 507]
MKQSRTFPEHLNEKAGKYRFHERKSDKKTCNWYLEVIKLF